MIEAGDLFVHIDAFLKRREPSGFSLPAFP